jgi:TRAP-type C4-dicarboxylate transport system permease small subunit
MLMRLNNWITECLLVIAAVLAFVISFVVIIDVIGRVGFNSPLKGTPEMVSSALVMILFLQAGYAVRSGGMINVDFLLARMPPRIQSYVMAVGALFGLGFFGFVCWGAIDPAINAWTSNEFDGEGSLRVPSWPARFIVVLGTGLAALSYLLVAIENLKAGRQGRGPAPMRVEPGSIG